MKLHCKLDGVRGVRDILQQQAAFTSCMPSCSTSGHARDGSLNHKADKEAQHSMFSS
jgi:hypothetical protein